jgi:two-component system sensor histidine kinase ChvG
MAAARRMARRAGGNPRFRGLTSLATRIFAVNLLAVLALAGALIYIESFRARLIEARAVELLQQGEIIAQLLEQQTLDEGRGALESLSTPRGTRVRLFDRTGQLLTDNWSNPAVERFRLSDPTTEGFRRESAILIDRTIDFLARQRELEPYPVPEPRRAWDWPEVRDAAMTGSAHSRARQNADRLVLLHAAVPVVTEEGGPYPVVLLTVDTPDVLDLVRRERLTSFLVFLAVLGFSLALSTFLARTVVVPLRQLALAAHRVRLGRQRDVVVPRLPGRRDEIGGLARALADMSATLRQRIDATESFAADVAHELKNPLASLRSAVETLGRVSDENVRKQLFALIDDDVRRIDRLVTDISAASRVDAELSRTRLQPVDLAGLARAIASAQQAAGTHEGRVRVAVEGAADGTAMVAADADRLAQVINNLLDSAVSFAPDGSTVTVAVQRAGPDVRLIVEDEGPGVPPESRDAIFERFYSERPGHERYGQHSGLGLSIVRAIMEALDGQVRVGERRDGRQGAAFVVELPAL